MIPDKLATAIAAGAKRAGIHALRAAGEAVAAVTAFVDEVASAFRPEDDDAPEHIEVEPEPD